MSSISLRCLAPRLLLMRRYASASSDKLTLTLSSPTKVFFNAAVVKQVDVPTMAGMVGILAQHVPTLGVLKPGVVQVAEEDGSVTKVFVSSGTLAMNIDGSCQVLAEEAVKVEDIDESAARQEMESAQRRTQEGSEIDRAEAAIAYEVADALMKAATGQAA